MTQQTPTVEPLPARATGTETIGATAIGGAALGSLAGALAGVGTLFLPVVGTAVGAVSGAGIGWLVRHLAAKKLAQAQDSSDEERSI